MLTVACVYKPGAEFTDEYVSRLRSAVSVHLAVPHRFVCYTNQDLQDERVIRLPLAPNLHGWFNKAALWIVEKPWPGPILYFDLDTMIVGNIDRLAGCTQTTLLRDLGQNDGEVPRLQTGVMFLMVPELELLRQKHNPAAYGRQRGDAEWVRAILPRAQIFQDWAPGQICSYKYHWIKSKQGPDCRVVCFHGKPRPADIKWDLNNRYEGRMHVIRPPHVP